MAADFKEQCPARGNEQSIHRLIITFCDVNNLKNFSILRFQPQEETGSAGGQPVSNKAEATILS